MLPHYYKYCLKFIFITLFRCQNNGPVELWIGSEENGKQESIMLVLAGINCNFILKLPILIIYYLISYNI